VYTLPKGGDFLQLPEFLPVDQVSTLFVQTICTGNIQLSVFACFMEDFARDGYIELKLFF
jgi:hypothetical protein